MSAFCDECWHNWYAHDDDDDDDDDDAGDWCRVEDCCCDSYVPADDGSIEISLSDLA